MNDHNLITDPLPTMSGLLAAASFDPMLTPGLPVDWRSVVSRRRQLFELHAPRCRQRRQLDTARNNHSQSVLVGLANGARIARRTAFVSSWRPAASLHAFATMASSISGERTSS